MPTIDVQCHTIPRSTWVEMQRVATESSKQAQRARQMVERPSVGGDPQMIGALDDRIALLDDAGLDVQVISTGISNSSFFADASQSADVARAANEEFSEACQRHPTRYRFFATLPLPHARESLDELTRAAKLSGFAGVMISADFGKPLDDSSLLEVYAELDRQRTLVFIHPNFMEQPERYARLVLEPMVGWPALDSLAVMELILGGICDRYPGFTIITPHLSGTMLFLIGRIDRHFEHLAPAQRKAEHVPSWYMQRMYHDSVCFQHSALELARTMVGHDHILMASDFPWQCRERLAECIEVVDTLEWPEEQRAEVRGGTMERLLRDRGYW